MDKIIINCDEIINKIIPERQKKMEEKLEEIFNKYEPGQKAIEELDRKRMIIKKMLEDISRLPL